MICAKQCFLKRKHENIGHHRLTKPLLFILSALIISFMSDYSSSHNFFINPSIKLIQGKVKLNSGKNLFQEK